MSEEVEAIMRLIADLRDKVKFAKDRITYLREEEKALRTEYETAPLEEKWRIRRELAVTWGAIGGITRWMRYYEARIRELERVVPPHKFLRYRITFSIITNEEHMFFAEVTCDTVVPKEVALTEFQERLVNAVVKSFWMLFDVQKTLYDMELAGYKGTEDYDFIVTRKEFIQKHAAITKRHPAPEEYVTDEELESYPYEVRETYMDAVFRKLISLDAESRKKGVVIFPRTDPEEYVTRESIIKIGVEPPLPMPPDAKPKYPLVYLLVEKGKTKETKDEWVLRMKLLVAKETDVNILKMLKIELE